MDTHHTLHCYIVLSEYSPKLQLWSIAQVADRWAKHRQTVTVADPIFLKPKSNMMIISITKHQQGMWWFLKIVVPPNHPTWTIHSNKLNKLIIFWIPLFWEPAHIEATTFAKYQSLSGFTPMVLSVVGEPTVDDLGPYQPISLGCYAHLDGWKMAPVHRCT